MPRHPTLVPAVCLIILAAAGLTSSAGPLDPPPGPIQPTMHTLDDIYGEIADQNGQWQSLVLKDFAGFKTILEGDGVVHAIIYAGTHDGSAGELRRADGTPIVVFSQINELGTLVVPLDVRYTGGLILAENGFNPLNAVTILYRPDGE